jgi:hypothetical protein
MFSSPLYGVHDKDTYFTLKNSEVSAKAMFNVLMSLMSQPPSRLRQLCGQPLIKFSPEF